MIMTTYFGSAAIAIVLGVVTMTSALSAWQFSVLVAVVLFIASAGASSAYLTISEVLSMESRALCIALFFAVGTAVGGVTGSMLFGHRVRSTAPGRCRSPQRARRAPQGARAVRCPPVPAWERHGPLGRPELERTVRGRSWGPGRFRTALKNTIEESRAQRLSSGAYTPPARAGS